LSLIFTDFVSLVRLQQKSANILGLHFPLYLCSTWEITCWNLSSCSSERAPTFSGKSSNRSAENEVAMTCYSP